MYLHRRLRDRTRPRALPGARPCASSRALLGAPFTPFTSLTSPGALAALTALTALTALCAVLLTPACRPAPPVVPEALAAPDPVYENIAQGIEQGEPEPAPPLAEQPALALTARAGDARATLARKQARAVEVSPDGQAFVYYGLGRTWIVSPEHPDGLRLEHRVNKARFSPDHGKLALLTATGVIVVATADGRTLMKWPGGKATFEVQSWRWEARFIADASVLMFDGCRLWHLDPDGASTVSGEVCGEPRASVDGRRWLIMASESLGADARKRYALSCPPTCQHVAALYALDPATGATQRIWGSDRESTVHGLAVSPDLGWYCGAVSPAAKGAKRGGHKLICRALDASAEIDIWDGATDGRAAFDATGQRLVFGEGNPHAERTLHVVDLAARTIQAIGTARADEDHYTFASPTRIVGTGGEQIFVYDLEAKAKLAVGKPGEWEGFSAIPGDDSRFLVGRDTRNTRDFFWIDLER